VALRGELGSGKTCFTRGIVAGAAPASAHLVASPTFAIMNEYPGEVPVHHFDFYRLATVGEIAELGFEEYLEGDGICVVEWSERLEGLLPDEHLIVTMEYSGDEQRRLTLEAGGSRSRELLARFGELTETEKFL
jgi:tRNA threonylcarbamoyladenosine biosynthesis protein TsaE